MLSPLVTIVDRNRPVKGGERANRATQRLKLWLKTGVSQCVAQDAAAGIHRLG